jgi:hypothetical protein
MTGPVRFCAPRPSDRRGALGIVELTGVGFDRYGVPMTAAAAPRPEPGSGSPPFADASPSQVREALGPEDAAEFDRQWRAVMVKATETLDLTNVHRTLTAWRRIAWLTAVRGPDAYHRVLATAEERTRTGAADPDGVSLDQVKALIAERLG